MMTRTEMIGFARENPFVKITHTLFSEDEYIYSKGDGCIYEEHDYLFEDWISERHDGIRMRSDGLWETGWSLYKEEKKTEMDFHHSHTGKEIREWCAECTNNDLAKEIKKEYFSKRGNQPSDNIYYFIETFPKVQLARDYKKSPKRYSKRY